MTSGRLEYSEFWFCGTLAVTALLEGFASENPVVPTRAAIKKVVSKRREGDDFGVMRKN
jgi:hypothetical protein